MSGISRMSDVRDPASDQPLPLPGRAFVHQSVVVGLDHWGMDGDVQQAIEAGLAERLALGIRKYGRPLESHNGRDALQDAWEEALDTVCYVHQLEMEGTPMGYVTTHAMRALEGLTQARLDRERTRGQQES